MMPMRPWILRPKELRNWTIGKQIQQVLKLTAKALGIVNDASLADYRIRKSPFSKTSHPWISGMSSSTRPDYPMFFGNAPSTEISADAFNNMVDAANSLNKVNIDLPIYVRIKKHREVTSYRHVPDWGLWSKYSIDKIQSIIMRTTR